MGFLPMKYLRVKTISAKVSCLPCSTEESAVCPLVLVQLLEGDSQSHHTLPHLPVPLARATLVVTVDAMAFHPHSPWSHFLAPPLALTSGSQFQPLHSSEGSDCAICWA